MFGRRIQVRRRASQMGVNPYIFRERKFCSHGIIGARPRQCFGADAKYFLPIGAQRSPEYLLLGCHRTNLVVKVSTHGYTSMSPAMHFPTGFSLFHCSSTPAKICDRATDHPQSIEGQLYCTVPHYCIGGRSCTNA